MSKIAFAAALPFLLLAACGGRDQATAPNGAVEANGLENSSSSDPVLPGAPANGSADPVPPPDAVSHPDGYLPPARAEAEPTNASAADPSPPATEDEYIRNGQAGR
jgi:hypothetical protein